MAIAPRELLRAMFDAAVDAASPSLCIPAHLPSPPKGRTIVVGAGKASASMAKALEDSWPGPLSGLIVTPGLIDLHTHVYWGGTSLGIDAEDFARSGANSVFQLLLEVR